MSVFWIIISIVLATGFAGLVLYWYAFRLEPVNFVLSELNIDVNTGYDHSSSEKSKRHDKVSSEQKSTGVRQTVTVLHLSDFHLRKSRKGKKLSSFVSSLKNIEPDLILLTGDLVEKDENIEYLIDMLAGLKAKIGKYAVLGVHDYYNKTIKEFISNMVKRKKEYRRLNDVKGLISKLDSIGIKALRNESVLFDLKDRSGKTSNNDDKTVWDKAFSEKGTAAIEYLQLIGLEDIIIKRTDIAKAFDSSSGYINGNLPEDDSGKTDHGEMIETYGKTRGSTKNIRSCFIINRGSVHRSKKEKTLTICMTHTPDRDVICEIARRGTDIVLCGHTHGGQVRIPGLGAIITGSNISPRYASGLFYFKDFVLYTSRGLGEGRYSPFRFFCRPEASLIKINIGEKAG